MPSANDLASVVNLTTMSVVSNRSQDNLTELLAADVESPDVLSLLSALLLHKDSASKDLIARMGECSSPREVVMAVQEELEKLVEKSEDSEIGESETSWVERLTELVELCRAAIPRMKLKKRTASDTLQPLLSGFRRTMEVLSSTASPVEAGLLMGTLGNMVQTVLKWVQSLPESSDEELSRCQLLLKAVLDCVVVFYKGSLGHGTAEKALEMCYPRLKMSDQTQQGDGQQVIDMYLLIYQDLGLAWDELVALPSIISVILLVRIWLTGTTPAQVKVLSPFTPNILLMLQPASNLQGDALAFLLLLLHHNYINSKVELSPDIIDNFAPILIPISSAHPSPSTRHQAFRVLSLLLASAPPQLRLQLLAELLAKSEFPQMGVAAVGLVKDAVLEALPPSNTRNVFSSPNFMKVFGPLLFRSSPPDLFDLGERLDVEIFLESPEPKRLSEVLSLYYVVLSRDNTNLTSIRDKDMLANVEQNLLNPLRKFIGSAACVGAMEGHNGEAIMPLVSLQVGLKRIEEATSSL